MRERVRTLERQTVLVSPVHAHLKRVVIRTSRYLSRDIGKAGISAIGVRIQIPIRTRIVAISATDG
jgi:hypothetical protein